MNDPQFVNPYTFVPHHSPLRQVPAGHTPDAEEARDLVSGVIDIQVTLDTPLLLPADTPKNPGRHQHWLLEDRRVRIPGSSVKGAVRAVHEAAFDGCLRIIDTEFVPSYRSPAKADTTSDGWTLAVVTASAGGRPTQFQVCDPQETVWVDAVELKRAWPNGTLPTSGDIVDVVGNVEDTTLDRYEVRAIRSVTVAEQRGPSGQRPPHHVERHSLVANPGFQVFLVTDTGARKTIKRDRSPGRCLWVSSVLTDTLIDFDPTGADEAAYSTFWTSCLGSNDRRQLEGDPNTADWQRGTHYIPVKWRDREIGRRTAHTGLLFRGDVVWVQWRQGRIHGIRHSQIWRYPGRGKVAGRIGSAWPCLTHDHDDDQLCLSCEIFGAADAGSGRGTSTTTQGGRAVQRSYAGHVRFGALTSTEPVTPAEVELAPLSTPNPGSGAFYLDLDTMISRDARASEVASHWGSHTDRQARTPIRGRKFYWHSDPDRQARHWAPAQGSAPIPRYQATPEQVSDPKTGKRRKTARKASLVPAGTVLRGKVTVDGLPAAYVASLLASLDPRRLLPPGDSRALATHLGGGKPLGLGTATVEVTSHLRRLTDRYAAVSPHAVSVPGLEDTAIRAALIERAGEGWTESQRILCQILDKDGLGHAADLVTYPPGASTWAQFGTQPFRESFEFFQAANGQRHVRSDNPLVTLPRAGEPRQTMRIQLPRRRGKR